MDVLNSNFLIEKGFMTTIHAFTTDQRILDNSIKTEGARSASQSSPNSTEHTSEIIPVKGKLKDIVGIHTKCFFWWRFFIKNLTTNNKCSLKRKYLKMCWCY